MCPGSFCSYQLNSQKCLLEYERCLAKVSTVYEYNEEVGECAFVKTKGPAIGSLGASAKTDPSHVHGKARTATPTVSDQNSQDRSYSVTNVTFPERVDLFITSEALEVLAAFKDAFETPSDLSNASDYERWLDKALVERWSWLKARHVPPTNSSSMLTVSTPVLTIFSASASDRHSPLLGLKAHEGSDFDVIATEVQIIRPSLGKSVVRDTLNSMTVDVATTTEISGNGLILNVDVQNSTSQGVSKEIAIDKSVLFEANCGPSKIQLSDSQRGNSISADFEILNFVMATNVTPAVLSVAHRWKSALANLSPSTVDPGIDRADHLDYTWHIVQAAERQGITSEPAFLGQTGPLLRPPDILAVDHVAPVSILTLREDIGWRILSQLRHYARHVETPDTLGLNEGSSTLDFTPEDLQAAIYSHFADWREWDVPQYDWIDLHCLQTSRQVKQSQLTREDIAFDSYSINDRKVNVSIQQMRASLFDVTALEGQQLGIISAAGLACSIWNAQTTDRAVRVQTVTLAAATFDAGVHVDIAQYVLPIYDAYEKTFEKGMTTPRRSSQIPPRPVPDLRRCFILGIDKIGLRINAEPLQFAFDTHGTHVVYSMCSNNSPQDDSERTRAARDAVNLVVHRSTMAVLHMNGSRGQGKSGLPRLFSLTVEDGQAAIFPNLRMPGKASMSRPSASILIQSISLETGYDPRHTEEVIQNWKSSRFS